MKKLTNREKLIKLRAQLGMTEKEVAAFLTEKTMRPVGYRTVQSWSNDPENPNSRPCQPWAVDILQAELKKRRAKGTKA